MELNLSVQVAALRKLFGADTIITVAGRGYQFLQSGLEVQDLGALPPAGSLVLPEKPSIAVLPFVNFSGDAEQAYFTDGLTEDITTELSRFRSLFVIARNSAFSYQGRAVDVRQVASELGVRYVLEGSARRAGPRVRVNAQLIDAISGNHIWSDKYDRVLADIFDVQEEVTRAIVGAIEPQIDHAEGKWARKSRPENLAAYGLALRAWAIANDEMLEPVSAGRDMAYALAQQAVKADAGVALAWRAIALIQWVRVYFNAAPSRAQALAEGLDAADRAISLDATDHIAMNWKGVLLGFDGQDAAALATLRAAHDINRNHVVGLGFLGMYEAWAGHKSTGVRHALEAFRLSPRDPNRHQLLVLLSFTYFANQQDAEALEIAEMAMHELPGRPVPYLLMALTQVGMGQVELAQESFLKLKALAPELVKARLAGLWLTTNPVYLNRALTFLRVAAGLESPEGGGYFALSALRVVLIFIFIPFQSLSRHKALNTDKTRRTAFITHVFEPLINRPGVERFPRGNGWKLQDDDAPGLPITFVDFVRTASGKVSGTRRIQRWLYALHEVLVARHVADFNVKNYVSTHLFLLGFYSACDGYIYSLRSKLN